MKSLHLFLILSLTIGSLSAQVFTQLTDAQLSTSGEQSLNFFSFEDQLYEYHRAGGQYHATNASTGDLVYESRLSICDLEIFEVLQWRDQVIFFGEDAMHFEGMIDQRDTMIEYQSVTLSPDQFDMTIEIKGDFLTVGASFASNYFVYDLNEHRYISDERRDYKLSLNTTYYFHQDGQTFTQDKETGDIAPYWNTTARYFELGDHYIISLGDAESVVIDADNETLANLNIETIVLAADLVNSNIAMTLSRIGNSGRMVRYYDPSDYGIISEHILSADESKDLLFLGSTDRGFYATRTQGTGAYDLLFWEYGVDTMEVLIDSSEDPLYNQDLYFDLAEDYLAVMTDQVSIVDLEDNRISAVQDFDGNSVLDRFWYKVDGEDHMLRKVAGRFVIDRVDAELLLDTKTEVAYKEGLGNYVNRQGDMYLFQSNLRGAKSFDYLYRPNAEMRLFESELPIRQFGFSDSLMFYVTVGIDTTLHVYNPSDESHSIVTTEGVDLDDLVVRGPLVVYSTMSVYNYETQDLIEGAEEEIGFIIDSWGYFEDFYYGIIGGQAHKLYVSEWGMSLNQFDDIGQVYRPRILSDGRLVSRGEDAILIWNNSPNLLPYPEGFGRFDTNMGSNMIIVARYDDDTGRSRGFSYNNDTGEWIALGFKGTFNRIVRSHILSVGRPGDNHLTIYDTRNGQAITREFDRAIYVVTSSDDYIYTYLPGDPVLRVYNYNLNFQEGIDVPGLSYDDFVYLNALTNNLSFLFSSNGGDFQFQGKTNQYALNTMKRQLTTFHKCRDDGAFLSSIVKYDTNVDVLFHTNEDGYQLYTFEFWCNDPPFSTSAEDQSSLDIKIYPNPASTSLLLGQRVDQVMLYTRDGRAVKSNVNTDQLDLGDVPNGFYNVRIVDGERIAIRKVIKM